MIGWSEKQAALIRAPFDHAVDWLEGTPRSGKTVAGTMRFARHLIASRDRVHLLVAYSAEQAYRLLLEGDGMGLLHIFRGHCRLARDQGGAHLLVRLPGGEKKVYWKGGGRADSRKAVVGLSLGSVYFCEIDLLDGDMVRECFRRTWAARDRWHIADCNPPSPSAPCIAEVLEAEDCRFVHWTCADNPVLTRERLEEIEASCRKSPFLYRRDWLGERTVPEGVIYWMFDPREHVRAEIPGDLKRIEAFAAADGGSTDATSVGFYLVCQDGEGACSLWRVGNWYYDGERLAMSEQARRVAGEFLPAMRRKWRMRETCVLVDPACKALRLELERLGLPAAQADNNARDARGGRRGLRVGVEMLQSALSEGRFALVDDARYGAGPFVREAALYCFDGNGEPVDAYNHAMDEARYAYTYFAKTYGAWGG